MRKIKFPVANVSNTNWDKDEDYLIYILHDEYIYTTGKMLYNKYFLNNSFVDSNGAVFKIVDRKLPGFIRQLLSFIPNFCKVELVFTKTGESMTIEAVRQHMIKQLGKLEDSEIKNVWIKNVKNAREIEDVI